MKKNVSLLLIVLIFSTLLVQAQQQTIAFTNVSVVPFDRERIIPDQTVIVVNGRIAQIGPTDKTKVPTGALQIDARGKYLMPGLADMHVHLYSGAGQPNDLASQQLQLFLANGVTTIRNMIGKPEHLALRDRVAKRDARGSAPARRESASVSRESIEASGHNGARSLVAGERVAQDAGKYRYD